MPNGRALSAYKLEYQLAATRYENIYKAIWQIFSYLAAIAGAILTFGGDHFQHNFLWVLASLPLFFWCVSTYLPMDRYGHSCLNRLAKIEEEINGLSGSDIKHYRDFNPKGKGLRSYLLSVRLPVHVLCIALGFFFIVHGYLTIRAWCRNEPLIIRKSDKPISLTVDELKKLMQQSPPAGQAPQAAKPPKSISQTPAAPPKSAPAKGKTK